MTTSADAELRARLKPYTQKHIGKALFQLFTTVALISALTYAQYEFFTHGFWWLSLIIAPASGLLLIRAFVLQHDCGHGSFFNSRAANDFVGVALSPLTLSPFYNWRYSHNLHHATNGNLDKRLGYFWIMTVDEFRNASRWERFQYRVYRHPLCLFLFGAFLYFVVRRRFPIDISPRQKKEFWELMLSNVLVLALYGALFHLMGAAAFLTIILPNIALGAGIGTWINYSQHFIPDGYMERDAEWDFAKASLEGSSFYDLPRVLHWATANIGFHHIHHFEHRIPNYNLPRCMRENRELFAMPIIKLRDSRSLLQYELWDEDRSEFVSIRSANA